MSPDESGQPEKNNYNNSATKNKMKEEKENNKAINKIKRKEKEEILKSLRHADCDNIKCGLGRCTPRWLQVFASREAYLLNYCFIGLVIGMFFTYSVSILSTIEKRFRLTSKQTGIILVGNDVSQVLLAVLVAYFGNYGNRPKWLGAGVLSASFACFLSSVPHFIYGPGQDAIDLAIASSPSVPLQVNISNTSSGSTTTLSTNKNDLCYSPYIGDCSKHEGAYIGPVVILFIAHFFVGLTVSVFHSLGLVYLDDNVNKKDTPLYYSVSLIIRVLGPVMGFFLGSRCLALYIDPHYKPNLSLRDPRWIGAWWLGYLVLCVLLLICGLLILLFPRMLPVTLCKQVLKIRKKEEETAALTGSALPPVSSGIAHYLRLAREKHRRPKPSLAKLPEALMRLFRNKIWVGFNINTVVVLIALMGYWNFKPKFLEYQFRKSASDANFYTGVASFVASVVGLSVSGIILKIFRPGPRVIAGYSCFLTVFSCLSMVALMFISCPKLQIVGPNYQGDSELERCGVECGCTDRYSPVCSEDGLTTFYSPCYAGCTAVNSSAVPVQYYNCICLSTNSTVNTTATQVFDESINKTSDGTEVEENSGGKTIQGYCPEDCNGFFYYIIITIITKAFDSTGRIGGTLIYLRSVNEEDKGLALGVSTVLISLFAFIPAPIIMGAIVDSACIIWDNTCGVKGNCWLYDSDKFRYILHGVPAVLIFLSLVGDIIVYRHSKGLILYDEKDDHEKTLSNTIDEKEEQELRPLRKERDESDEAKESNNAHQPTKE